MPTATEQKDDTNATIGNGYAYNISSKKKSSHAVIPHWEPSLIASYPSQSLRFLKKARKETGSSQAPHLPSASTQARLKLNIVVVGAGLGGLALSIALARRGHSIRVLEQATKLGEVGAGIQIPPNSGRLLHSWGVFEHLEEWVVKPEAINFRRWENGQEIGRTALGEAFQDNFEVPYYVVHRAHFHNALHQRALQLGVSIQLGARIVRYNEKNASVELSDGTVVQGDLVIAADGIKSIARETLCPEISHELQFNGFAAYRATVDVKKIREDPEIAWIVEKPSLNIWIGENRHVMTYTIAAGETFNMVLSHIDQSDPATWTKKFAKEDIQQEFSGWDPHLTKIISLIDDCLKWPLKVGHQLKTWTCPSSKLIIIGDAAHAMLPYMSQGAAMAVEDGAALAVALNHISSLEELPFALRTFEKERIKRSSDMQNASTINGTIWHFADGPEQRARDESMAAEVAGLPVLSSANQWTDPVTQWWAYGYDAEEAMEKAWSRAVSDVITQLR
ncbi:hypothetical protein N0V83_010066 [Neocucurbitaria cava]|uniref:FAD-binding domain-containing protein n=1 Tax=Neocucurbitaria cava TaxID=798079 RepID=A0A9W9CHM4_9PLEO|nr:hypothetical protein N0V83_010066 [Neocucurbitaria cava]